MARRHRNVEIVKTNTIWDTISKKRDEHKISKLHRYALDWYQVYGRSFPWRNTDDPYKILVAEVCLQKTDAEKVLPVYQYLVDQYPNLLLMSQAGIDDLYIQFAKIGLVKRASYILQISKYIVNELNSKVPKDRNVLKTIRGIGDYTANSVLCLAYNTRLPLLDGSTQRILTRVFDIMTEKPAWANKMMREFMAEILPKRKYQHFNLALIDIAAKYCRPKNMKCFECPLSLICDEASNIIMVQ